MILVHVRVGRRVVLLQRVADLVRPTGPNTSGADVGG